MKTEIKTNPAPVVLTPEQTREVAGGLIIATGCRTCTSGGNPAFQALASAHS